MKIALILAVLAACALPVRAQLSNADEATKAKCKQYLKTPLPAESMQVSPPKAWPACASYKLYSGIGMGVDVAAARKCAWSERLAVQAGLEPRFTVGSVFGGSAMLTQIYANGEGVERNLPLASRFACEAEGAPAEIDGRIQSIEKLSSDPKGSAKRLAFCDDITSGFMMGFCSAYSSELADAARATATAKLTKNWTGSQKAAFHLLLAANDNYAKAHAAGEVDTSGTARAMFQIQEEDGIRDSFMAALKSFEAGTLPKASVTEATAADSELNRAYQKAVAEAEAHKADYGAIQPEGIRKAERAWLKYRTAWIAFAKARYPSVSEPAWLKLLSADRVLVLQGKCCGPDPEGQDATKAPRPLP